MSNVHRTAAVRAAQTPITRAAAAAGRRHVIGGPGDVSEIADGEPEARTSAANE